MHAEDLNFTRPLVPYDCVAMGGCGPGTKRTPRSYCGIDPSRVNENYNFNWPLSYKRDISGAIVNNSKANTAGTPQVVAKSITTTEPSLGKKNKKNQQQRANQIPDSSPNPPKHDLNSVNNHKVTNRNRQINSGRDSTRSIAPNNVDNISIDGDVVDGDETLSTAAGGRAGGRRGRMGGKRNKRNKGGQFKSGDRVPVNEGNGGVEDNNGANTAVSGGPNSDISRNNPRKSVNDRQRNSNVDEDSLKGNLWVDESNIAEGDNNGLGGSSGRLGGGVGGRGGRRGRGRKQRMGMMGAGTDNKLSGVGRLGAGNGGVTGFSKEEQNLMESPI